MALKISIHGRHVLINFLESIILIVVMACLLALCSYLVWGKDGIWLILINFLFFLFLAPKFSPYLIMRLYHAEALDETSAFYYVRLLTEIAERAELPKVPELFYIPSSTLNAFSVGSRKNSAIAVTDGLLRLLNKREMAGVLAHEVSHIRHNDLWIMGMADLISRLTALMAHIGILLLILNLPFILEGEISWLLIGLLIISPSVSILLQLSLSRLREFNADLFAAKLTGDPRGLATALTKLDYYQGGYWKYILTPGRYIPDPSALRSHPQTEKRVERLMSLIKETNESDGF